MARFGSSVTKMTPKTLTFDPETGPIDGLKKLSVFIKKLYYKMLYYVHIHHYVQLVCTFYIILQCFTCEVLALSVVWRSVCGSCEQTGC